MKPKQVFDTSQELLVQRYKHGIHLVRPDARAENNSHQSISALYNLPITAYFFDREHAVTDVNKAVLEIIGVHSISTLQGKTLEKYTSRALNNLVIENNNTVIQSESLNIIEESGIIMDDVTVHAISFKLPWYYENNIIGLFGCSIQINAESMSHFASTFTALLSTGLFNVTVPPIKIYNGIYFSRREDEVLKLLMRGKTAKEIGERLNISKRTAEHYITALKLKTKCATKSELVDKFIDQFIIVS